MGGKLIEPKIISDFNNNLVAMLPMGFILMTSAGKNMAVLRSKRRSLNHGYLRIS